MGWSTYDYAVNVFYGTGYLCNKKIVFITFIIKFINSAYNFVSFFCTNYISKYWKRYTSSRECKLLSHFLFWKETIFTKLTHYLLGISRNLYIGQMFFWSNLEYSFLNNICNTNSSKYCNQVCVYCIASLCIRISSFENSLKVPVSSKSSLYHLSPY